MEELCSTRSPLEGRSMSGRMLRRMRGTEGLVSFIVNHSSDLPLSRYVLRQHVPFPESSSRSGERVRRGRHRDLKRIRRGPLPPLRSPASFARDQQAAQDSRRALERSRKGKKKSIDVWETFHASNVYVPDNGRLTVSNKTHHRRMET